MSSTYTPRADCQTAQTSKIPDRIIIHPEALHRFTLAVGEVLNRIDRDDEMPRKRPKI